MLAHLTSALNMTQTTALLPNFCWEGKNKKKLGFNVISFVPYLHILRPHENPLRKYNEKHFTEEQTQGIQVTQLRGAGPGSNPKRSFFLCLDWPRLS